MFLYIIPSFFVGLAFGAFIHSVVVKKYEQNQTAGDNAIQTQTILLDANTNREISSIVQNTDGSKAQETLNELSELINNAAQNGQTVLYIGDKMNKKIKEYLTKTIIKNFLEPNGYTVDFWYSVLENPEIYSIKW